MMVPGSVDADGEWVEAASLAREIEQQMIAQELLDPDDETEETTTSRRKTFVAISTAAVNHLTSDLEISLNAGDLRAAGETSAQLPRVQKTFEVVAGQVTMNAGGLRGASDGGTPVPLAAKTLAGKVR